MPNHFNVSPSAKRLSQSLRDVGYSFESAVADLVDNAITAGCTVVDIQIVFSGRESKIVIRDNGLGMDSETITEAMRFGSRREYVGGDLGRYGLGLKTASLSQCRRVEVFSKTKTGPIEGRALDLDYIEAIDDWLVTDISDAAGETIGPDPFVKSGTAVVWKRLDRILPASSPEGGWARRKFDALPQKLSKYLSMVFHRFLSGENNQPLKLVVNGVELQAWDPFARDENTTVELAANEFEIETKKGSGSVQLRRFILHTRENFSSPEAYERQAGVEKWNRQQGIYIYRANRLVQWGGWAGIRTSDEHTKLARASLDFGTDLDEAFNINVAKMRVSIPSELRKMIARPVNELCMNADAAYRKGKSKKSTSDSLTESGVETSGASENGAAVGLALRAAAARSGHSAALSEIMKLISRELPEVADYLGFD